MPSRSYLPLIALLLATAACHGHDSRPDNDAAGNATSPPENSDPADAIGNGAMVPVSGNDQPAAPIGTTASGATALIGTGGVDLHSGGFQPLGSQAVKDAIHHALNSGATQRWQDGHFSGYAVPSLTADVHGCRAVRYTVDQQPGATYPVITACDAQ